MLAPLRRGAAEPMHKDSAQRVLPAIVAAATLLGVAAAIRYARLDLALSHYDARGHLVVARRIIDSITPGWQQIGAVWLPLPHLINALPVQIDTFYRTGASAIAISIASFAVATGAIAWSVARLTGSALVGGAGALVFALNPNVLYLQATPMTEPLLMALTVASIALLMAYCDPQVGTSPIHHRNGLTTHTGAISATAVGVVFALACLTRYEAWPVTFGSLGAAVWVLWRQGVPAGQAARRIWRVARFPAAAVIAFTIFSRIVIGAWFASGFFVPENPAQGRPWEAVKEIAWGLRELSGPGVTAVAIAGALLLAWTALARREQSARLLPLALIGTAAVPWSAFVDGHPYRIRYMVPLIAAQAICAAAALGMWRRARVLAAAILLLLVVYELRPLDQSAPMIVEAQWDRPNAAARAAVTACLREGYRGDSIMASMGSLGHYMQDLSRAGFSIRDFLHEGNGDIWLNALHSPRPFAGWILIEEKAEGGDMLAQIAREHPAFLDGYERACDGAGLALYRRLPR
jgi:hypothetical protein